MNEEPITSLQNPRIKQLVKLRDARERKKTQLTRIDGARELLRAMGAQVMPVELFVCESKLRPGDAQQAVARARDAGVPIQLVDDRVYEKIRYGERDEGLCAVVSWSPRDLNSIEIQDPPFVLVVEGVEKPGNLGALLRTADAAGVDAVILADPACEPANPNVVRASMGTVLTAQLAVTTAEQSIEWLSARGIQLVVAHPEAERLYTDCDLTGPIAIVMGAEHGGLSQAFQTAPATAARLPMAGHSDSLNLSAATAIVLYEAVRQRSILQS